MDLNPLVVGKKLSQLRNTTKLSILELSDKTGISSKMLYDIEGSVIQPSYEMVTLILSEMGYSIMDLFQSNVIVSTKKETGHLNIRCDRELLNELKIVANKHGVSANAYVVTWLAHHLGTIERTEGTTKNTYLN